MNDSIPTGKLKRAGVAGLAAAKIGAKHLGHFSKRPFLSRKQAEKQRQEIDDASAEAIFNALSHLRGTALKVAQMLSMETDLLPERYRRELAKSYHQVPPLNRALIRKVVIRELGDTPENIFASFEGQAFAAASLGQVHAAGDEHGNKLAVKLQYPGIDISIRNDLQLVRSLVKHTKYAGLMLISLDEIEQRLCEEVDYRQEADHTEWFRQHLNMTGVLVPEVYQDLSSQRVLTTARLPGLHLDQWLQQNPSQERRNHFAQRLYDVFVQSFYGLHALHADPNPGNYLFAEDGALGLVDFGCVRYFSSGFVELIPVLMRAYIDHDAKTVINTYAQLGVAVEMPPNEIQDFYDSVLRSFGDWLTQPFRADVFDFNSGESSYITEGRETFQQLMKFNFVNDLSREFIFFDRTFLGLYQIFERLGATVKMQHQWLV